MATSFTLDFSAMTPAELASFVEFALELVVDAAWLRYKARADVEKLVGHERGVTVRLDRAERLCWVIDAFDEAIDKLSPASPFREPLRRYVADFALPLVDEDDPPPAPKLQLVP